MIRVSDYLIDFLYKNGVSHIFMVAGGGAMHLNDSVALHKQMKHISHHHEQAAAMAAEAYARITENIGVALVTTGPGGTNAITGLLGAWQDSIPCIFISGQDKRKETIHHCGIPGLRQFGPQEANIIPIVQSITKYSEMINIPEKIRYHLEKALYIARSGRPGPVWLDIPLDVQGSLIDPDRLAGFNSDEEHSIVLAKNPSDEQMQDVISMLRSSRKPLILAGHGIRLSKANDIFLKLIRSLHMPMVSSNMAADIMDHNDPLYLGIVGMKGHRAANIAIQNCDTLLSIGCRLPVQLIGFEYEKFSPDSKKIVVDVDIEEHKKKTINIDMFVESDAKIFIQKFLKYTKGKVFDFDKQWAKKLKELTYRYPVSLPAYAKITGPCDMYFAIDEISKHCSNRDIIISDAGFPYYMVAQGTKIKKGQRLILPGATAPLGYNLPGSIGAAVGGKKRNVICITGDGSLQTNIHELGTIAVNSLPIKIFVLNNGGYLSIRITQKTYFEERYIGESKKTGLGFPDLKKIADAYGLTYYVAKDNTSLKKVLPELFRHKGPLLCEIICKKWQTVAPTVTSKTLPDGTMISTPIDDMFPFLSKEEMTSIRNDLK